MLINTKEFQAIANTILLAVDVDKSAATIELVAQNNILKLNVTNKEYYVSVDFPISENTTFKTVVDAHLFLNLITGITTESFELILQGNTLFVKADKSSYKLPMIYEGNTLMAIPKIELQNKTVEMDISNNILKTIATVNTQEITKVRKLDINELQKLYYIDETGCFTFTTGACVNTFTLDKPIKLLLNDKVVKLFKLFKSDVHFSFGHDALSNDIIQTKVVFEADNVYMAAIIPYDNLLLQKIQAPCNAAKGFIAENYDIKVVVSVEALRASISRLMLFIKNSVDKLNALYIPIKMIFDNNELSLTDSQGNVEIITVENNSFITNKYELTLNLVDIKAIIDTCKDSYITIQCGNHRSIVFNRGLIYNLVSESVA